MHNKILYFCKYNYKQILFLLCFNGRRHIQCFQIAFVGWSACFFFVSRPPSESECNCDFCTPGRHIAGRLFSLLDLFIRFLLHSFRVCFVHLKNRSFNSDESLFLSLFLCRAMLPLLTVVDDFFPLHVLCHLKQIFN